jgi:hypothetical protein
MASNASVPETKVDGSGATDVLAASRLTLSKNAFVTTPAAPVDERTIFGACPACGSLAPLVYTTESEPKVFFASERLSIFSHPASLSRKTSRQIHRSRDRIQPADNKIGSKPQVFHLRSGPVTPADLVAERLGAGGVPKI